MFSRSCIFQCDNSFAVNNIHSVCFIADSDCYCSCCIFRYSYNNSTVTLINHIHRSSGLRYCKHCSVYCRQVFFITVVFYTYYIFAFRKTRYYKFSVSCTDSYIIFCTFSIYCTQHSVIQIEVVFFTVNDYCNGSCCIFRHKQMNVFVFTHIDVMCCWNYK